MPNLFTSTPSSTPSSTQTTTGNQTTGTTFTAPIQKGISSALAKADTAFGQPWTQLDATKYVAPANAAQQQYWTGAQNLQAPTQFNQAGDYYTGVGNAQFGTAEAQRYMNPYTAAVTKNTMDEMQRQYDRELAQLNLRNTSGAGLGSSGFALAQALANKDYSNRYASTLAGLQQAGFQDAYKRFADDLTRRMEAGRGLESLGSNVNRANIDRLTTQGLAATDRYNLDQRLKDLQLSEAQTAREAPMKMASNYANLIAGLPREVTNTQENKTIQDIYGVDPSVASIITGILSGGITTLSQGKDLLQGYQGVKSIWNDIKGLFS